MFARPPVGETLQPRPLATTVQTVPPLLSLVVGTASGAAVAAVVLLPVWALAASTTVVWALALATLAWAVFATVTSRPAFERPAQVPLRWRATMSGPTLGFVWGLLLGTGFATRLVVAGPMYGFLGIALLHAGVTGFVLQWLIYGASRGATIAVASVLVSRASARGDEGLVVFRGVAHRLRPVLTVLMVICGLATVI